MRVVIADDHEPMREDLRSLLEAAHVDVVGEAANGHEVIAIAERLLPDVVLMDVGMPELNGIAATARLRAELPNVKVVALSVHADAHYARAAIDAGALGYVVKEAGAERILAALSAAARGESYLWLGAEEQSAPPPLECLPSSRAALTAREREVLRLVADGKSSKEVAVALRIALATVESHRRQIMRKLDVRTIAELTKYAIREGLTSVGR